MELNFNLIGTFRLFARLNDEHLEVKLKSLPPAPAIVASSSDNAVLIFVVVESCDMATALLDIMAVYFVSNNRFGLIARLIHYSRRRASILVIKTILSFAMFDTNHKWPACVSGRYETTHSDCESTFVFGVVRSFLAHIGSEVTLNSKYAGLFKRASDEYPDQLKNVYHWGLGDRQVWHREPDARVYLIVKLQNCTQCNSTYAPTSGT